MEKSLKILLLIGIPASGKSTWSDEYVSNNPSWVRVCRDDFRFMLKNAPVCEPKIEDLITTLVNVTVAKSLSKRLNVIVDATNLKLKYINQFVNEFKYDADIDYRVFDISIDKAIERDKNREKKVGEAVIKKMFNDYKVLMDIFNFQPVNKQKRPHLVPTFESELPDAVCFDIDGTIALMKNRGPFDWMRVDRDDVNHIVSEHIHYHKEKGRTIILLSGRDEVCRGVTENWLNAYEIPYDHLFMRPKDDQRKDTIVKRELYHNNIKDNFNVLCVYDDRLQVLDMWYDEGVFAFNVNQGNREF